MTVCYGWYIDLHIACLYRKYRASQLTNPCEAHIWRMKAYRAEACALKLQQDWLRRCAEDWQAA